MKRPTLKRRVSLRGRESLKGYLFLLPMLVGLVAFFLIPTVKSFLFSVSDVTSGASGYRISLSGFSAYYEALFRHTSYRQTVTESAIRVVTTTPLVLLFSFFMASVLNQKFRGRVVFRVILFLPVILTVMNAQTNTLESSMSAYGSFKGSVTATAVSFTDQISQLLIQAGLSETSIETLTGLINDVYHVISLSAIQILILLIGMQAVSPSLYEAARVEGATAWESFWKITFPMVSPMILVCTVYTVIDSFTDNNNAVMSLMSETAFTNLKFSLASAMGWIYFLMIAVLLGVVGLLFSRLTARYSA